MGAPPAKKSSGTRRTGKPPKVKTRAGIASRRALESPDPLSDDFRETPQSISKNNIVQTQAPNNSSNQRGSDAP
ncbi:hypothetical protein NW762_006838 [Fusarium torreyae]|uniref:Uncharacterized protein n=1 Tax=Fusarium torreyae TaxID=1237075 RepID=A0A9W8RZI3_9HYPO|nr:hypothetical protein NW762_006838 [Fusarium torreyae]